MAENTQHVSFKDEFTKRLSGFSGENREIFDRIYKASETIGYLDPPKEMYSWIIEKFGSAKAVESQDFIKIMNVITHEGASFNELRTLRPVFTDNNFTNVIEEIAEEKGCKFSIPLTTTPADIFGRIKGKYCITASNIAKYDELHGLIIFDEHNPLLFSRRRVRDYFDVANKWFKKAQSVNKSNLYPFLMWNCLWKAGASITHGHCQLTLSEDLAHAKIEFLRSVTKDYQETHQSNYFDDVFTVHNSLGLAFQKGDVRVISKITPIKEKEIMIISPKFDDQLAELVSDVLNTYKKTLGVASFNLSIILPPMGKTKESWDHMPIVIRVVDRGRLSEKTADIGAMELYAQSVIGTNPYLVYEKLKKALKV